MEGMTHRERLISAIRCEPVEGTPFNLLEINPFVVNWRAKDPSYAGVLEALRGADNFAFVPVEDPNFTYYMLAHPEDQDPAELRGLGDLGFLFTRLERRRRRWDEGSVTFFEETVHTPKGPLKATFKVEPGVMTSWVVQPFLKEEEDLEKLLSLPYIPPEVDLGPILELEGRVGEDGLLFISLPDPVGALAGLSNYEEFLLWCWRRPELVDDVLNAIKERMKAVLEEVSSKLEGAVFRFWGSEYAAPPMLPPDLFRRFVTEHDGEIFELVRRGGNFSCLHIHGPIRAVADQILEVEPDLLEPVEPPPYGDMSLKELFNKFGGKVCLMGHVEGMLLETGSPEDVERAVRDVLSEAEGREGFILSVSSAPFVSPLPKEVEVNLLRYIEVALSISLT